MGLSEIFLISQWHVHGILACEFCALLLVKINLDKNQRTATQCLKVLGQNFYVGLVE
jgi:hypothetical protein